MLLPPLQGFDNVTITEPLSYGDFAHAMNACSLMLTDSGGVQEEAPSLGKPVLVLRDNTERPEAVDAGTVRLVGTDEDRIVDEVSTAADRPGGVRRDGAARSTRTATGTPRRGSWPRSRSFFGLGDRLPDWSVGDEHGGREMSGSAVTARPDSAGVRVRVARTPADVAAIGDAATSTRPSNPDADVDHLFVQVAATPGARPHVIRVDSAWTPTGTGGRPPHQEHVPLAARLPHPHPALRADDRGRVRRRARDAPTSRLRPVRGRAADQRGSGEAAAVLFPKVEVGSPLGTLSTAAPHRPDWRTGRRPCARP